MKKYIEFIVLVLACTLAQSSISYAWKATPTSAKFSPKCLAAQKRIYQIIVKANELEDVEPSAKKVSHDISKDSKGNISVDFSVRSGTFGTSSILNDNKGDDDKLLLAQIIKNNCPNVQIISFSGATWSNWALRQDGFSRIHRKYDEHPGCTDFYFSSMDIPFTYNLNKDYDPAQ